MMWIFHEISRYNLSEIFMMEIDQMIAVWWIEKYPSFDWKMIDPFLIDYRFHDELNFVHYPNPPCNKKNRKCRKS